MDRILIIMKKWTTGIHLPIYWGFFHNICKHVYLYIQQISGERLQGHWSSGTIYSLFLDIHFLFKDIHNSFMDILNSFMDILKYLRISINIFGYPKLIMDIQK